MAKLRDQIDASVFVEHLLPARGRKEYRSLKADCRKYFYRLGEEIEGSVSYCALGEITQAIIEEAQDEHGYYYQQLKDLLRESGININAPTMRTYRGAIAILKRDTIIKPSDALRLAEARTLGQNRFVTIDRELLENKRLHIWFKLKVVAPS